jgi:hypothetical protein
MLREYVAFEDLKAEITKHYIFSDVTPCSLEQIYWCLGGTACCFDYSSTLNTEARLSSETLINVYQARWCHISEDSNIYYANNICELEIPNTARVKNF